MKNKNSIGSNPKHARNQQHASKSQAPCQASRKNPLNNDCLHQSHIDMIQSSHRQAKIDNVHSSYLEGSMSQDNAFYKQCQRYDKKTDSNADLLQRTSQFYKYENIRCNADDFQTLLQNLYKLILNINKDAAEDEDPFSAQDNIIILGNEEWQEMKELAQQSVTDFETIKSDWFDLTDSTFKELEDYQARLKSLSKRYQVEKAKSTSRLDNSQNTIKSIQTKMEDSIKVISNDICRKLDDHKDKFEREIDLIKYDNKQRNASGKQHIQVFEDDFNEFIINSSRRHIQQRMEKTTPRDQLASHRSHQSGHQSARHQEQLSHRQGMPPKSSRRQQEADKSFEEHVQNGDYLTNPVFLGVAAYQPSQFDRGLEDSFDCADQTLDFGTRQLELYCPEDFQVLQKIQDADQREIYKQIIFMKHEKELKRKHARDKEIKASLRQANGLGNTTPRGHQENHNRGTDSDATQVYPNANAGETPLKSEGGTIDLSGIILQSSLSSLDTQQFDNVNIEYHDAQLQDLINVPDDDIGLKSITDKQLKEQLAKAFPVKAEKAKKLQWSSEEGSSCGGSNKDNKIKILETHLISDSPNGFESSSSFANYEEPHQREQKNPPNIVVPKLPIGDNKPNKEEVKEQRRHRNQKQRDLDTIQERVSEFQSSQYTNQVKMSAQKNYDQIVPPIVKSSRVQSMSNDNRESFHSARVLNKMEEYGQYRDIIGGGCDDNKAPKSYRQQDFQSNKMFKSIQDDDQSSLLAEMEANYNKRLKDDSKDIEINPIFEQSELIVKEETANFKDDKLRLYEEVKTPFKMNDDQLYNTNLQRFNQMVSGNITNSLTVLKEQITGIPNQTYEASGVQFGMMSGQQMGSGMLFNQLRFRNGNNTKGATNQVVEHPSGPWSRGGEPTCKRGEVHRDGLTLTSFSEDDLVQQNLTKKTQMMMQNFHQNFYYNQCVGVLFTSHVTQDMGEEFLKNIQCSTATYKPQIFRSTKLGNIRSGQASDKDASRITQGLFPASHENSALRTQGGRFNIDSLPQVNLMKSKFDNPANNEGSLAWNEYMSSDAAASIITQPMRKSMVISGEKPNTVINRSRIRNLNLKRSRPGTGFGAHSVATSFLNDDESLEINDL